MNPPCNITQLSASELSKAIHSKDFSCAEVMQAYLTRIAKINPAHNAIIKLRGHEELIAQAKAHDALLANGRSLGWLHGVPQAIKETTAVADDTTTAGSPLLKDYVPSDDAIVVARAKSSGAIVIGRTNVPELGLGSHTFNPLFGSTKNAFDVTKSAGGSSGGAAVAAALHMLPVVDGSDVMGSLRNPAAWANLYGIRPSLGRVPQWPTQDVWTQHLLTDGPMARTLEDLARMLAVQSGADQRCPLSLMPAFDLATALRPLEDPERRQVRILWLGDMAGYLPLEEGVEAICVSALQRAQNMGCHIEYLASLNQLGFSPEQVWQSWLMLRQVLVATKVGPLMANPKNHALIRPEAIWEYEESLKHSANALTNANAVRSSLYLALLKLFEMYDAVALPTAQIWPFDVNLRYPTEIKTVNGTQFMDTYHRWMESSIYATMAGLPAMSVPVGFGTHGAGKGLAMGMQLIGKPQGDAQLLRLASLFEANV